jgi:hypothetical protein
MGGNRRRRRKAANGTTRDDDDDDDERAKKGRDDDAILVRLESDCDTTTAGMFSNYHPPVRWSVDHFAEESVGGKRRKSPHEPPVDANDAADAATDASSSIAEIGMHIARGALDRISRRGGNRWGREKSRRTTNGWDNDDNDAGAAGGFSSKGDDDDATAAGRARPTPVQLRLWPALLHSLESRWSRIAKTAGIPAPAPALNVVGIAPTGTGEKPQELSRAQAEGSVFSPVSHPATPFSRRRPGGSKMFDRSSPSSSSPKKKQGKPCRMLCPS